MKIFTSMHHFVNRRRGNDVGYRITCEGNCNNCKYFVFMMEIRFRKMAYHLPGELSTNIYRCILRDTVALGNSV